MLSLDKLSASIRQIDTAITLYFKDEDPVSIHTLAAAANQVLSDLKKARGLVDHLEEYVKPQYVQMVRQKLKEPENFFKHADKDPEAKITLNPEATEITLLIAIINYHELGGGNTRNTYIMQVWLMKKYPLLILDRSMQSIFQVAGAKLEGISKSEFYEYFKTKVDEQGRAIVSK